MGLVTIVAIAVIVLVAIGLGVSVFFSGLFRGAEIIGQNPAVQNATQETQQFVEDKVDTQISAEVLVLTTDEATYSLGEPVIITVKNIGPESLSFRDSALGLQIEHIGSDQKYRLAAAQVITELEPGESKTITWNPQDENAPAGNYIAMVHTTGDDNVSAQVSFQITE